MNFSDGQDLGCQHFQQPMCDGSTGGVPVHTQPNDTIVSHEYAAISPLPQYSLMSFASPHTLSQPRTKSPGGTALPSLSFVSNMVLQLASEKKRIDGPIVTDLLLQHLVTVHGVGITNVCQA